MIFDALPVYSLLRPGGLNQQLVHNPAPTRFFTPVVPGVQIYAEIRQNEPYLRQSDK